MDQTVGVRRSRVLPGFCGMLLAALFTVSACRQEPASDESVGPGGIDVATAPADTPPHTTPKGMDGEDHPDAPRALPRSAEVQGWIKIKPAESARADALAEFVDDPALRGTLSASRFERFARATYQSPHAKAVVFLAEGLTSSDALGAFSLATEGAGCTPGEDGSLRSSHASDGKLVLIAWQGDTFVRLEGVIEQEPGRRDCEKLLARTVFGLPLAEPPLLMRAVKEVTQEACRFWITRSAGLLVRQPNPRLKQIDPAVLNERLGLTGDAMLSVVAVEQTRGAAPIVLWLAEYPTDEAAKAAGERYAKAVESEPRGLDAVTFVGVPKGHYLIGTWTADQETARGLVNMLTEALPQPPAPRTRPS